VNNFDKLFRQFQESLGKFLITIQTVRTVDVAAFREVHREASELARVLKAQPLLPKSLLNELRVATKILRAEAPYLEGARNDVEVMADELETTFVLILKGVGPEDRRIGVPRIV
jgi:hypothetical protein